MVDLISGIVPHYRVLVQMSGVPNQNPLNLAFWFSGNLAYCSAALPKRVFSASVIASVSDVPAFLASINQ